MEQRISVVTLGVTDLAAAKAFYDSLGWKAANEDKGEGVVAYDLISMTLALYPRDDLARDSGVEFGDGSAAPVTLACNVRERQQVETTLADAERAGGKVVRAAADTFWGGHAGCFADPDGHLWEIAFNPFAPLGPDGSFQWNGATG